MSNRFRPGMTGDELMESLQYLTDEQRALPVVFVCDYGDYSHTQQALPIRDIRDGTSTLHASAYSQSGWAVRDTDEDDEDFAGEPGAPEVLVLVMSRS